MKVKQTSRTWKGLNVLLRWNQATEVRRSCSQTGMVKNLVGGKVTLFFLKTQLYINSPSMTQGSPCEHKYTTTLQDPDVFRSLK